MRPSFTLSNRANSGVRLSHALNNNQPTENESTTGNRIVRYYARCTSCDQISYPTKQTLIAGRACPVCKANWPAFSVTTAAERRLNRLDLSGNYVAFHIGSDMWVGRGSVDVLAQYLPEELRSRWAVEGAKTSHCHLAKGAEWIVLGKLHTKEQPEAHVPAPQPARISPETLKALEEATGTGRGLERACEAAKMPLHSGSWYFMPYETYEDIKNNLEKYPGQIGINKSMHSYGFHFPEGCATSLGHENPHYVYVYEPATSDFAGVLDL
jgi:hypothetical protein